MLYRAGSIFLYLLAGLVALLTWLSMVSLVLGMVVGGVLILIAFGVQVAGISARFAAGSPPAPESAVDTPQEETSN